MLFNSFSFAIFFPLVTLLYFIVPLWLRVPLLLAASCYFYMAFIPVYILFLFLLIGIDYGAGLWIEAAQSKKKKKLILGLSLFSNLLLLGVFKYYNFFTDNLSALFGTLGITLNLPLLSMALPIGLSFHTFQSM